MQTREDRRTEAATDSQPIDAMIVGNETLATLNKSEINQQIATAHEFPRSVKVFLQELETMATLNEAVADECIYAIPRDGKMIEGPSVRFAELVVHSWGNSRAGARVVAEGKDTLTAQGVFHDLEKNVAITYEVQRRITDKHGRRYKPDMIATTANAACAIALRNAVFKGVPKAFWSEIFEKTRKVAMGDAKTLATRRADMLAFLRKFGATDEGVCKAIGVRGVEDIDLEKLVQLKGMAQALKDGESTVEEMFPAPVADKPETGKGMAGLKADLAAKQTPAAATGPAQPTPEQVEANKKKADELKKAAETAAPVEKNGKTQKTLID